MEGRLDCDEGKQAKRSNVEHGWQRVGRGRVKGVQEIDVGGVTARWDKSCQG